VPLAAGGSALIGSLGTRGRETTARGNALDVGACLLAMAIAAHALIISEFPAISLLKSIYWGIVMYSLGWAWASMGRLERVGVECEVFSLLLILLAANLPLTVTAFGYRLNEAGFQGFFGHPQPIGLTMALLFAWQAASVFAKSSATKLEIGVLVGSSLLVYLSESRTAALAAVAGTGGAVLLRALVARVSLHDMLLKLVSPPAIVLAVCAVVALLVDFSAVAERAETFVSKNREGEIVALGSIYAISRGALMDDMMKNIGEHPLLGIGFGVPSDPGLVELEIDPMLGLPTSAPIEKGNAFLATFEELGAVGSIGVAIWLLLLVRKCEKGGLVPLTLCLTYLATNFGEATLFSPSGFGLAGLLVLAMSMSWSSYDRPE